MMTDQNSYAFAKRFDRLPECVWRQTGSLRVYIKHDADGSRENILEMLYMDGNDSPFWAPIPKIHAGETS